MNVSTEILPQMLAARIPIPFQSFTDWLAKLLSLPPNVAQDGFWTIFIGGACATCCALAGCFLVLRRMSLMGDALSHSVLAGTAGVYLLTGRVDPVPMLIGALLAGILTAVLTQFVHDNADVPEDSSIGIVFTSLFAFGVVVVSQATSVHLDLDCVLFGSLEFSAIHMKPFRGMLWPESFRTLLPAFLITVAFVFFFWKELRMTSFDPVFAVTVGFSASIMHYTLTTVVAVVTISAMEVVGLLVVALLIVPPATARLLTNRLSTMLWLSCLFGIASTTIGYLAAYHWDSSAAGMTAVTAGVFLLIAILIAPGDGVIGRTIRTIRLRIRICAEDVLAGLFRMTERSEGEDRVSLPRTECLEMAGGGLLASPALKWLMSRRLLQQADDRFSLTDKGIRSAKSLVRSHRLWEAYLSENFDLDSDHLHDPAEAMEHYIGPELQRQITDELSGPAEDPHGRAIPDRDEE